MKILLAIYPNTKGFGFACLEVETPQNLIDSGVFNVRPLNNARLLKQVKFYIGFHEPEIILLRDTDNTTNTNERLKAFSDELELYAAEKKLVVHRYSKEQIRAVFEIFGATTKTEIARKICTWFADLRPRMPKERKPWLEEDYNLGVFNAVSLAVTHHYLE